MRFKSLFLGLAATGLAATPIAASAREAAGVLSSASGSAFVSRDGRLLAATPAMQLVKGDRVVTRAGGSAKVSLNGGCDIAVGSSATANVSSCASKATSFDRAGYEGDSSALRGRAGAGGFIIALLAVAVVIVGIIIFVDSDDDPDSP